MLAGYERDFREGFRALLTEGEEQYRERMIQAIAGMSSVIQQKQAKLGIKEPEKKKGEEEKQKSELETWYERSIATLIPPENDGQHDAYKARKNELQRYTGSHYHCVRRLQAMHAKLQSEVKKLAQKRRGETTSELDDVMEWLEDDENEEK